MQKASNVRLESSSVKYAHLAISHQYVSRKTKVSLLIPFMQGNQKHNNYMQGHFTPFKMQRAVNMSQGQKIPSVYKWKFTEPSISHLEVPKLVYLMANLAYCLQEYHTRNQYLWARLDTCADVNLMPMAVYCLMFKDPQLKKLTPSNMEIETYTTEVMKIIGTCHFYLVHPESKQLSKVMFFVAKENGSILLSCRTTM